MPAIERNTILARLQAMKRDRIPIVGGGAGTGLSAKCEEAGGIDLIVIYNSGRYRMAGRGSLAGLLAYGNANEIVREMAYEVLPVVKRTPVLAGVNGTDPFCLFDPFLDDLKRLGFSGVQNFPTVGLIDGLMRANLEETGMSYALEVEMIALAHAKGMLTTPYVFCPADAEAMAALIVSVGHVFGGGGRIQHGLDAVERVIGCVGDRSGRIHFLRQVAVEIVAIDRRASIRARGLHAVAESVIDITGQCAIRSGDRKGPVERIEARG